MKIHDFKKARFGDAADWALVARPGVVALPTSIAYAVATADVNQSQLKRLHMMLRHEYLNHYIGTLSVWLRVGSLE